MIPFAIALLVWAVRKERLSLPVAGAALALMGAFSITATRDVLVFERTAWHLAGDAIALGALPQELDGGAGWTTYQTEGRVRKPASPYHDRFGVSWWIAEDGGLVDQKYVVSTAPLQGYVVLRRERYSVWLGPEPAWMFLSVRR